MNERTGCSCLRSEATQPVQRKAFLSPYEWMDRSRNEIIEGKKRWRLSQPRQIGLSLFLSLSLSFPLSLSLPKISPTCGRPSRQRENKPKVQGALDVLLEFGKQKLKCSHLPFFCSGYTLVFFFFCLYFFFWSVCEQHVSSKQSNFILTQHKGPQPGH